MKTKIIYALFCLLLIPALSTAQTVARMTEKPIDAVQWMSTHFAHGTVPPFSFEYGGRHSSSFITQWKYRVDNLSSDNPRVIKRLYTYFDNATGLQVTCEVMAFTDYRAVEWVLRFCNTGQQNSPEIANVKVSDVTFNYRKAGDFTLHYPEGSHASNTDFSPHI